MVAVHPQTFHLSRHAHMCRNVACLCFEPRKNVVNAHDEPGYFMSCTYRPVSAKRRTVLCICKSIGNIASMMPHAINRTANHAQRLHLALYMFA